jgi:hypothetical protein
MAFPIAWDEDRHERCPTKRYSKEDIRILEPFCTRVVSISLQNQNYLSVSKNLLTYLLAGVCF